jgi:hypothetical protein
LQNRSSSLLKSSGKERDRGPDPAWFPLETVGNRNLSVPGTRNASERSKKEGEQGMLANGHLVQGSERLRTMIHLSAGEIPTAPCIEIEILQAAAEVKDQRKRCQAAARKFWPDSQPVADAPSSDVPSVAHTRFCCVMRLVPARFLPKVPLRNVTCTVIAMSPIELPAAGLQQSSLHANSVIYLRQSHRKERHVSTSRRSKALAATPA